MQTKKYSPLVLALALTVGSHIAGAQTTATGQVVAPGTQPRKPAANPCNTTDTTAAVSSTNDANCLETSPGFAVPGVGKAAAERPRNVVAFVRVDTVIPRPPVAMPDGDSFSVVGSATLVKVHRSELADCLATGKRISARSSASTSTTCLDHKGELLAYQECKTGGGDCIVVTPQDISKQQESSKTP
ncbi:MAG: hypothetical protein ACRYGF_03580 [Janthinobacterium lividum]